MSNLKYVECIPNIGALHFSEDDNSNDDSTPKSSKLNTFLTLKVLFWDIGITVGDTITDYCQGVALLLTPDLWIYGVITLALNWLPGIPGKDT